MEPHSDVAMIIYAASRLLPHIDDAVAAVCLYARV